MSNIKPWYDSELGIEYTGWDHQRQDYYRQYGQQWVYRSDDINASQRRQTMQASLYAGHSYTDTNDRYPDPVYGSSVETIRPRIDSLTQGDASYSLAQRMYGLDMAGSSSNPQGDAFLGSGETVDARLTSASQTQYYKKRKEEFFTFGRVLKCCWSEQAGPGAEMSESAKDHLSENTLGVIVYSKYRIFVVIKDNGNHSSTCIPVNTYGGQGVAKKDVVKHHHSIFYDSKEPPPPRTAERPKKNERGMRRPIRVKMESKSDKLDPMSRINFNMPHPIQHNWKVYGLGMVHDSSLEALRAEYNALSSVV